MRRMSLAFIYLLATSYLFAGPAPTPEDSSTIRPGAHRVLGKDKAYEFAETLLEALQFVRAKYLREVTRADLLEAAIGGLYDAAQVSRPKDLHERLTNKQYLSRPTTARDQVAPSATAEPDEDTPSRISKVRPPSWLVARIADLRASLGDREVLRDARDLMVSLQAVTQILDPDSVAIGVSEYHKQVLHTVWPEQNFGIGLAFAEGIEIWPLVIRAVAPGSPAQKAGLRPGDAITHIDGKDAKGLTRDAAKSQINGGAVEPIPVWRNDLYLVGDLTAPLADSESALVNLTVQPRECGKPKSFTVYRECFSPEMILGAMRYPDNSWDYWIDRRRRIAHIRIKALTKGTDLELRAIVQQLSAEQGFGGLILDLRWTVGDELDATLGCVGVFLKDREVACAEDRNGVEMIFRSPKDINAYTGFPIVVLINGDTMGGAELIAAALQDHNRAVIVGVRTRGKASRQDCKGFVASGRMVVFNMTVATFKRPSGKALNRFANSKPSDDWGVRPDEKLECVLSPALSRQLREWWEEQTLRPGSSNKALPLDDPENDPQRQLALKALLRLVK